MKNTTKGLAGGIVAAAIVAGVAVYFLSGKHGEKNRKKLKGWMLKVRGEVLDKIEGMGTLTEDSYHNVIDRVASRYGKIKNVDPKELQALANDLHKHWDIIKAQMKENGATPRRRTRKGSKAKASA